MGGLSTDGVDYWRPIWGTFGVQTDFPMQGWSQENRTNGQARCSPGRAARESSFCRARGLLRRFPLYQPPPLLEHRVSEISPLEQSTTGPAITHFWYWDMNKLFWQGPDWWVDGYTEVHRAEPAYPCQNGILVKTAHFGQKANTLPQK